MDEMQAILAEWSCAKTIRKYAIAADGDDVEAFADLFEPDAIWQRPDGKTYRGHGEIRAIYAARPAGGFSRHLVSNIVVDLNDSENARARSVTVVLKAKPPADAPLRVRPSVLMVAYDDTLRRSGDGQWRLLRRESRLLLDIREPEDHA
jgi:ketosteroid isomerase-like protein